MKRRVHVEAMASAAGASIAFFSWGGACAECTERSKRSNDSLGITWITDLRKRMAEHPSQKELIIRDEFMGTLRQKSGAQYFLPFRFKAKDCTRPSHYLIHWSDNWLAFKLMKNVMWDVGKGANDPYGSLDFLSDDERGIHLQLIRPDIEEQKRRILEHLGTGHRKVSEFTDTWMRRPTDIFSDKVYRRMLQELEAAGRIHVYDKNDRDTAPASSRPTRNSAHTLGDDYWLRLPAR